jgi:hypothetical protein
MGARRRGSLCDIGGDHANACGNRARIRGVRWRRKVTARRGQAKLMASASQPGLPTQVRSLVCAGTKVCTSLAWRSRAQVGRSPSAEGTGCDATWWGDTAASTGVSAPACSLTRSRACTGSATKIGIWSGGGVLGHVFAGDESRREQRSRWRGMARRHQSPSSPWVCVTKSPCPEKA